MELIEARRFKWAYLGAVGLGILLAGCLLLVWLLRRPAQPASEKRS
jgi:hypothetical protein